MAGRQQRARERTGDCWLRGRGEGQRGRGRRLMAVNSASQRATVQLLVLGGGKKFKRDGGSLGQSPNGRRKICWSLEQSKICPSVSFFAFSSSPNLLLLLLLLFLLSRCLAASPAYSLLSRPLISLSPSLYLSLSLALSCTAPALFSQAATVAQGPAVRWRGLAIAATVERAGDWCCARREWRASAIGHIYRRLFSWRVHFSTGLPKALIAATCTSSPCGALRRIAAHCG